MMNRVERDLALGKLGFVRVNSIVLDMTGKELLSMGAPTGHWGDLYLYQKPKSVRDFVVIYPYPFRNWKVKWAGDVADKLQEVADLESK